MNRPENSVLVKFLKGQISKEEALKIQQWLDESPENEKELEKVKTIWISYEDHSKDYEPDMIKAWDKIDTRINSEGKTRTMSWFYRVAAILVLGIGIGYMVLVDKGNTSSTYGTLAYTEFQAQDNIKEVTLPDGTIVTLNEGASLSYEPEFGSAERRVSLKGEAFFDVKRDEDLPFIIDAGATVTRVLGTSFSVSPTQEAVIVSVVSGKVAFGNGENEVTLTKGEKGNYSTISGTVTESLNEDLNFLSWKTKKLQFQDAPFATVAKDLEKFYSISFETNLTSISRLTASFDDQSLEEVIEVISSTLDIEIQQTSKDQYLIQ